MLSIKTNPVGIDIPIQNAQKQLHKYLMREWGLDTDNEAENKLYQCYGRAYRNQEDNGYIAEVYAGGNEYREVYWNDNLHALSFFGISTEVTNTILNQVNVHLVVFADLKKLALKDKDANLIAHRSDEELRRQVYKALGKFSYGFNYQGFELGIENVLREYPGTRRDDKMKHVDMHPVHCFRFNYNLTFDPNKIC